jgi:hypothetical protein
LERQTFEIVPVWNSVEEGEGGVPLGGDGSVRSFFWVEVVRVADEAIVAEGSVSGIDGDAYSIFVYIPDGTRKLPLFIFEST